jgi:two-component system, LytTR family, sensor kinase
MDNTIGSSETESSVNRLLERRSVRLAIIWIGWTLVGLFFTSQILVSYAYMKNSIPFAKALFWQMSICYLWALATPLVFWLARRFRIERQHWLRRILLHAVVGLVLVSTMSGVHYPIFMPFIGYRNDMSWFGVFKNVFFNLDRQLAIYWLLVMMSHALNYYNSFRQGQFQSAQLRTQLVQSQLEALKMQLHPHFLFNTLHSISALLNKDTEAARRMISRLGDFLRLTLENAGTQEVTLQEEMEFLNSYLEIERIRFQDRLTTNVEVDPRMLDVRVPNLILQPIVENAMRHAVATHTHAGRIEITAMARNGCLRIQVKDNGPGLAADQVSVNQIGKGVGLSNTKARLECLYGSEHLLELANDPNGGLVVTLEIPRKE